MMMAYKSRIDRLQCLLCVVVAIILLNISQHQCEGMHYLFYTIDCASLKPRSYFLAAAVCNTNFDVTKFAMNNTQP